MCESCSVPYCDRKGHARYDDNDSAIVTHQMSRLLYMCSGGVNYLILVLQCYQIMHIMYTLQFDIKVNKVTADNSMSTYDATQVN